MPMKTDRLSADQISKIKKMMAFTLRHKPFLYKIKLNADGFAKISDIISISKNNLKIDAVTSDDISIISKQFSGGIFEVKEDLVRARAGHTVIYRMSIPDKYVESSQIPAELFVKLSTYDFVKDEQGKIILSNKSYTLSVDSPRIEKNYIVLKINTKKAINKGFKFYQNDEGRYYTPFVFSDSVSIHVQ